jgi:hypothetical protein
MIDNLNSGEMQEVLRRLRRLETAPIGPLSITRDQFRIGGTASMLFDASGLLTIRGTCNGSGAWTWTGATNLNGPTTINGGFGVTGATTLAGPIAITGNATLSSTLTVTGQITSGSTTLNSAGLSNSSILFLTAPTVSCQGALTATGNVSAFSGLIAPNLPTGSGTANVLVTSTGAFQKITSARRFKIDPQPLNLPDALLDVPVKAWIDKGARERGELDLRIPGVIAEEVEAAGGETFVGYDPEGRVESVAYDRFALARTQILADRLNQATQTIEAQGKRITDLTDVLSRVVGLLEGNTTEETR